MSAIAESLRKQWLPLSAVAAGGLVALAMWLVVAQIDTPLSATSSTSSSIRHAPWSVDVKVANATGGGATARRQGRDAMETIDALYEGLFITGDIPDATVTQGAARSLARARAGAPRGADVVRFRNRWARITVDPKGFASARVFAAVGVRTETSTRRYLHHALLWLERDRARWKVVAYELDQKPAR